MNLREEWIKLLQEAGPGKMMTTAYDTAWIARLVEIGEPIGHLALEWLREHQLPDGTWGAEQPYYYHDRTICTLAAINALARRGRPSDRARLRRAEAALEDITPRLQDDPAGETIGFELIVPTLLHEAKALGAIHREETEVLKALTPLRAAKLAMLPNGMINRFVTVAFSAEMAGSDERDLLDVDNLQEYDGSVSYSPSATAYFALYVHRRNSLALDYLHRVAANGIAPNVSPFDTFEPAWILWNLKLAYAMHDELLKLCQPHLDFLKKNWAIGKGIGFAAKYASRDSDVTSLVYDVLSNFGIPVDLEAVLRYEQPYYFRCYDIESNPSVSANIHVLGALRRAGLEISHSSVQKVLYFLAKVRNKQTFWFDKWQASPYYATSHAIISCSGYADEIIANAVNWIIRTQNRDGSWGYYMPTAEETAYCLQALAVHKSHGYNIPSETLYRGSNWLMQNREPPYPPLWIGKCLYSPVLVVRSAILSALCMTGSG